MKIETPPSLTERQKAAVMVLALGTQVAAKVLQHLSEGEIEALTLEIANVGKIPHEVREAVVEEFYQMCLAKQYILEGDIEYAKKVLENALGETKAKSILDRVSTSLEERPFDFAKQTDPMDLVSYIAGEHPQTVALVVAHLPRDLAAAVVQGLPPDIQAEVAMRVATLSRLTPEAVKEVERVLRRKLSHSVVSAASAATQVGGVEPLVEILNKVDRTTEKTILETLEEQSPELADEVKKQLFLFEDIVLLDDRAIQQILRDVESKELSLALKSASEDVKSKVFKNMSERAANMLREDMEFMGPVRVRDVEDAQTRIVAVIRRLEEAGEIVVSRGGEDELIA